MPLFDLLTVEEDGRDGDGHRLRFDIPLLSERLEGAIHWAYQQADLAGLPIGLFGASTGAADAIHAAVICSDHVAAVVTRGGRPGLAFNALPAVICPTLFVVGGSDLDVLELNTWAAARVQARHHLVVVAGGTHLFDEPGALEQAIEPARDWVLENLRATIHSG